MSEDAVLNASWADDAKAPLDCERLSDVLRGMRSSAAAFLADFRSATDVDAQQLVAAADAGDLARVEHLAHRMEGASRMIGAGPMTDACATLTMAGSSGNPAELGHALKTFLDSKRALERFMETLDADGRAPELPRGLAGAAEQICYGLIFLVVEDHAFQRGVIVRLLRQLGALEVHSFADGAAALAAARAFQRPAILVLDLAIPGFDGMELMRMTAQEQLPMAVIISSAQGQDLLDASLNTARSYGGNVLGAVSKPLTGAKLAPVLAEHRRARQRGSPKSPVQE